jgi:hypothetical protein
MLLLALLLWLAWQQQWWKGPQRPPRVAKADSKNITTAKKEKTNSAKDDPASLDRRAPLKYTRHAKCRMECRHVTEEEVVDILTTGVVNTEKSNPLDEPCPTYALEGYSDEGQHLRVVFAPCEDTTSVVTCIDLDKDWACSCN